MAGRSSCAVVHFTSVLRDALLLTFGLLLIIKGGDLFVSAAIRMAEFLRMPRVVIGSTLVSLATTTPELVVSITAGLKGESGLAVGNAVGSCICNVGLILGVAAALSQIDIHPRSLRVPLWAMFLFGGGLFLLTLDLSLTRSRGLALVAAGLGYFIYDFMRHAGAPRPGEVREAAGIEETVAERVIWFHSRMGTAVQFLGAAGLVVLGSRWLVAGAVNLASALGIPSIVIGLTLVAVGTSLPELVTAVTSARREVSDLAVGNVLGANIANLTLIVGTAAAISDLRLDRLTQRFNFPAMLVVFGALLWALLTGNRVTRKEGVWLLVLYVFYLGGLVLLTAALK